MGRTQGVQHVNATISAAQTKITRMAMVLTFFFVVCIGFDAVFYVLDETKLYAYTLGTPLQEVSVL